MIWSKKSLIIIASIGILLLLARPATISQAQGPCGPGQIDMLDYMLPTDQSSGNQMSNGECFYTYEDRPGHFYIVKSCGNGIWLEEYYYDNNGIYLAGDTTWTDQCPDGSYASAIHTGGAGQPGALRYPRCVSDPGAGGTASIAPAQGCVSGLSKDTCDPCQTTHSGCYTFDQTLTHNADGTVTVTATAAGESYTYDPDYGWVGFDGPTGSADRVGDSGAVEPDPALIDCIGLPPPPGVCHIPFPEWEECCPIVMKGSAPNWLVRLFNFFGRSVDALFAALDIAEFTLRAEAPLIRSEQLPMDANYFWASFEEQYDPRRIALPDEEAETGMWPGAALRLAPPDYRPSAMWSSTRKRRLKWQIPLTQYKIYDPWWGDEGKEGERSRSAHHPLKMGAEDAWQWLINTPGLEERIASASSSLSGEINGALGIDGTPQLFNPPATTSCNPTVSKTTSSGEGPSSSQTLGIQALDSTWGDLVQNEIQLAATNGEETCLFITTTCTTNNWNVHCDVGFSCLVSECGHYYAHLNGEMIGHGNCTPAGALAWDGSVSPGTDSATFTATIHGDPAECKPGPAAECTIDFDTSGSGSCTASAGSPCAAPPDGGADVCNPPYPAANKDVCSDVGPREVTVTEAIKILLKQYIQGGFELFPEFTYLERISYRLAGISNEMFKDYKEEGIGGVFNAFLPPGWSGGSLPAPNEYPTLDAPFDLSMFLDVHIKAPCLEPPFEYRCEYAYQCCSETGCRDTGGCHECNPGEECRVRETQCRCCIPLTNQCPSTTITRSIPLKPQDDMLRIRYLGSQTEALRQTQQWLAPPE